MASTKGLDEAIAYIEENTVYRVQAVCDDGSALFTSTNGMPTTRFTRKQIDGIVSATKLRGDE